ncbi:tetratricopeptide repeat protein [Halioxenophilus aromaticivorans]|uniref:Proteolytic complex protein LbcA n=1 Tax=Halioxenophilus aromaticivorans TaxID=1306992 RepID=A0AAV3U7K0_9ALTE
MHKTALQMTPRRRSAFNALGYLHPAAALLAAVILAGCASQAPPEVVETPALEPEPAVAEPEVTYKPFAPETLYSLIVADLALDRGRYDIGLGNYVQQAHATRDPAVAARATRIARFLNANQATMSSALLWLEVDPDNIEARVIAANELAQVGRLTEAFEIAKPLAGTDAQSIFQTIAARATQSARPQQEILLDDFNQLIAEHPNQTDLLVSKGLILQAQEQHENALAVAEAILQRDADSAAAVSLQSRSLQALGRHEEARQRLEAMLQRNPSDQRLRLDYARLLADDDLELARDQFQVLLEQSPDDANYLFSLALINNEIGETDTAKAQFTQLIAHPSRGASAHFYLGEIALAEGDNARSLTHFLQVDSGPDFLPALNRASDIAIAQGDISAVRDRFVQLRQAYSNQEERLYIAEAEILARHQMLDEAVATLTNGLTFHANNASLLYARAMLNEQRDHLALMEQDLRAIILQDTDNATALNALGYTLADRTDRYQEALELINQALSLRPDDPAIIDSLGWVQYRLGNYTEAVSRLREAMKAFPDHEVAAHLGEVLWVTGAEEEARQVWQEGLRLNPRSPIIPAVMERLDALQR